MPARFSDRRKAVYLLPTGYASARDWIYAIGFVDGTTKIGRSVRPRERVITHMRETAVSIAWAHVFGGVFIERHRIGRLIERRAHELAARIGTVARGTEVFSGLARADAFRIVRQAVSEHTGT